MAVTGLGGSANKGSSNPAAVGGSGYVEVPSCAVFTALNSRDLNKACGKRSVKAGWSGGSPSSSDNSGSGASTSPRAEGRLPQEGVGESDPTIDKTSSSGETSCRERWSDPSEQTGPQSVWKR